ncbi:MFS 1 domain containing protein [Asbolus verrucosus]|uniref:MFS 1 domain containing protein n=1 Tax=Asbolus verrucosus TaxID=1661398 RepID=A0A482VH08_ASBVE|nr:MFS 1 domain containing protein [Asbolus verrucosus]
MELSNVQLLLLVNFLDAACTGLVVPVMAPHIMMMGGNHIILGLLVAGVSTCQLLSEDFIALFDHGKRFILTFCMFTNFLCYLLLAVTSSYWLVLSCRYIYALLGHVDVCSKEFATLTEPEENHVKISNLINIMRTGGIVAGAITGGYVFDCGNDFESNAMIAAVLTISGVFLLQYVDQDPPGVKTHSNIRNLPQTCWKQLRNLQQINYKDNWDIFLLKAAYVSSFAVYFTKYSLLIRYNYDVGTIVVGYTVAYQNMLIFASNCLAPCLKRCLWRFPQREVFEHCLLLCAVTLVGLYYAPTYDCYLIVFIPMIFTYTLVNCFLEDDVLDLKSKQDIHQGINTLANIIVICVPFMFGAVYHVFGARAFKIMSLLPPAVCAFIINQHFLAPKKSEETEEHGHQD